MESISMISFEELFDCVLDYSPGFHQSKSRRDILLEYVKNVQPEFMDLFLKRAPQQVC